MIKYIFIGLVGVFLSGVNIIVPQTVHAADNEDAQIVCARGYIKALRLHSRFGSGDDQNGNGNGNDSNIAVIVDSTGFHPPAVSDDKFHILKADPKPPVNKWIHISERSGSTVTDRRWTADIAVLMAAQISRSPVRIISHSDSCVASDHYMEVRVCASEADCNQ